MIIFEVLAKGSLITTRNKIKDLLLQFIEKDILIIIWIIRYEDFIRVNPPKGMTNRSNLQINIETAKRINLFINVIIFAFMLY